MTTTLSPGQSLTVTFTFAPFKNSQTYGDVNNGNSDAGGSGTSTGGKCTSCDGGDPDNDPTD